MSQKDYSGYTGRKRRFVDRPPKERANYRSRTSKKHKIPGIKCTADRYKALKIMVVFYEDRVKDHDDRDLFRKWSEEALKSYSQKLKRMECDLRRRDLWRRIQEYL